ncbi:MAG: hypothetical protein K0Q94_4205 [Paenibacillus sp.]|nr:hypothetical protein [Paenibacillus sp.]
MGCTDRIGHTSKPYGFAHILCRCSDQKEKGGETNMSGIGGFSCGGGFTSTGVILVLFILLVIVSRAFI